MSSTCCLEKVIIWTRTIEIYLLFVCLFHAGDWQKTIITTRDIIRLHIACDVMAIDARKSIYNMAVNAFGERGVNTNM